MQIEHRFTALSFAMAKAAVACAAPSNCGKPLHPVAPKVADAIDRNQGLKKVRGWNANLSFKTAQKLKQQGVISA